MTFTELELILLIALAVVTYMYFSQRKQHSNDRAAFGFMLHKIASGEAQITTDKDGDIAIAKVTSISKEQV